MRSRKAIRTSLLVCLCGLGAVPSSLAQDVPAAPVDTSLAGHAGDDQPSADVRAEAAARFQSGVALFEEEDYEGAIVEFERAMEAVPNPVVLYNLAQSHLALRDYVAARAALLRYIEWPGADLTEERRQAVQFQIDTLDRRIGSIRLTVNQAGASVSVDGANHGTTPLAEPILVATGRHQVIVSLSGYDEASETIAVAGGTEVELNISLEETETRVTVVQAASEPSHAVRTAGQVLFSVGLATGIGAAVGLGFALDARGDYDAAADRVPADEAGANDARARFETAALATDILAAAGIALGGLGVILWIVDDVSGGQEVPEDATPAEHGSARLSVGANGLTFTRTF